MISTYRKPSRVGKWIVRFFLDRTLDYGLFGDIDEMYNLKLQESGRFRANVWFWLFILKLAPVSIKDSIFWGTIMIRNYFKTAIRNLLKNKLYTFINMFGLGMALGWAILAYVNYEYSESYDKFHENYDNIYRINSYLDFNGLSEERGSVPYGLNVKAKEEIPGIVHAVRVMYWDGMLRYEDRVFNEEIAFADPEFFSMLSFPLVSGSNDIFTDQTGIIISEDVANKYFGEDDAVGKQIVVTLGDKEPVSYVVKGVVKNVPLNSSVIFDILLPIEKYEELLGFTSDNWFNWTFAQLIQIDPNVSAASVEARLQDLVVLQNEARPERKVEKFGLVPMAQIANNSRELSSNSLNGGMPVPAIIGPTVIGVLTLLIACFNFMNTAIAYSTSRLKEIGIRKVLGGLRRQLTLQFLSENIILCCLALAVGILSAMVIVPFYDGLWPNIDLELNFTENLNLLGFLFLALIFSAVVSGAYPAIYISKFHPVTIFKGKQKLGSKNIFVRSMLTFQFSAAMMAIIAALVFTENAEYQRNFDLGYADEGIIVVPIQGKSDLERFKNAIEGSPGILGVTGSGHVLGRSWTRTPIEVNLIKQDVNLFFVGEDYLEILEIDMSRGESFNWNLESNTERSIIVTEKFVSDYGLADPLGKNIKFSSGDYTIIGVTENFHYNFFWDEIRPMVLMRTPPDRYRYASVKYDNGDPGGTYLFLQNKWKELFPELPFDGAFQEDYIYDSLQVTNSIRLAFVSNSVTAVFIACMGLFALVSMNIAKRIKEIGMRKILGATFTKITGLVSKEFLILLAASTIVASFAGQYLVKMLLESIYRYHVGFSFYPFIVTAVVVFGLAVITVGAKILRAANANPADILRYE